MCSFLFSRTLPKKHAGNRKLKLHLENTFKKSLFHNKLTLINCLFSQILFVDWNGGRRLLWGHRINKNTLLEIKELLKSTITSTFKATLKFCNIIYFHDID